MCLIIFRWIHSSASYQFNWADSISALARFKAVKPQSLSSSYNGIVLYYNDYITWPILCYTEGKGR